MDPGDVDLTNSVLNESSFYNLHKMIQDLVGNSSDSHIGLGKFVYSFRKSMTSRRPRHSKRMANHWENVAKKLQKFVTMLPRCCKNPLPLIEIYCNPCRKNSSKMLQKCCKIVAKLLQNFAFCIILTTLFRL